MKNVCIFCQHENSHSNDCFMNGLNSEQVDKINKIMKIAVSAIYFNDSSDYLPALKNIVYSVSPDIYDQLENNESKAFTRVCNNGVDDEED